MSTAKHPTMDWPVDVFELQTTDFLTDLSVGPNEGIPVTDGLPDDPPDEPVPPRGRGPPRRTHEFQSGIKSRKETAVANPIALFVTDQWGDSPITFVYRDELLHHNEFLNDHDLLTDCCEWSYQDYLKVYGWHRNVLLRSTRFFDTIKRSKVAKAAQIKASAMRHWLTLAQKAIRPNGALRGGYGSAFAMAAPRI